MYFDRSKPFEENKAIYRKLAFKFHPDHGGTTDQFADLQTQWEEYNKPPGKQAQNTAPRQQNYKNPFEDVVIIILKNSKSQKDIKSVFKNTIIDILNQL